MISHRKNTNAKSLKKYKASPNRQDAENAKKAIFSWRLCVLAVSILFSKFQTTKFVDQQLVFEESQFAHPHPSPQSLDPIPEPDEENTDSSQPQSEAPPDPASAISTPIPPRLLHPFNSKQLARPSAGQPATSAAAMRAIFEPRPPAVKKNRNRSSSSHSNKPTKRHDSYENHFTYLFTYFFFDIRVVAGKCDDSNSPLSSPARSINPGLGSVTGGNGFKSYVNLCRFVIGIGNSSDTKSNGIHS